MALFSTQLPNSQSGKNSVNTRGIQLYNSLGIYKTTISFGFWNELFLTVGIAPVLPNDLQGDHRIYDYDRELRASITATKIMELLNNYDRIVEAYKKGETASCYVDISGNNLAGYGTKPTEAAGQIFYFAIHRNLNDERIPLQSAYYQFNQGVFYTDYDVKTGDYKSVVDEIGEMAMFKRILEQALNQATHGIAHSIRVVQDWWSRRTDSKLDAIVSKLGISPDAILGGTGGFGGRSALFDDPRMHDKTLIANVTKEAEATFLGNGQTTNGVTPEPLPVPDIPPKTKEEVVTELPTDKDLPF